MAWRRRVMWTVFFVGLFAVVLRWHGLRFSGPHHLLPAQAVLEPALNRKIDRLATSREVDSPRKALDLALELTSQSLKYTSEPSVRYEFGVQEAEGNDAAYTQLFVAVFNRIADGRQLKARARAVRSTSPTVFGLKLPKPAPAQHDWVMVQPAHGTAAESWFVDPTFHDALLGWGIEGNVTGFVPIDSEAEAPGVDEPVYDDPEAGSDDFGSDDYGPGDSDEEADLDLAPQASRNSPRKPASAQASGSRTNKSTGKATAIPAAVIQKTDE